MVQGQRVSMLMSLIRHTPYAGAATIEEGIVIDLKNMPSIGLAPDHETITVSPSQKWDDVYQTLDAFDLSTLGGRVAGVGVGGLTTGCKSCSEFHQSMQWQLIVCDRRNLLLLPKLQLHLRRR